MTKLSALPTETTFASTDFFVKVKAAGGGDVLVSLANLISVLSPAWSSWTPTITLNGGGSNGNATITGTYFQLGKLVHFTLKYVVGSTTSFSSLTNIYSSLPVTANSVFGDTASGNWANGVAIISGTSYLLGMLANSTTQINIVAQNASGTYTTATSLTGTIPGTWATGSTFFISGTYQAA